MRWVFRMIWKLTHSNPTSFSRGLNYRLQQLSFVIGVVPFSEGKIHSSGSGLPLAGRQSSMLCRTPPPGQRAGTTGGTWARRSCHVYTLLYSPGRIPAMTANFAIRASRTSSAWKSCATWWI